MPIKVIVNGAHGRMGQLACEALRQHADFALVAQLGRAHDLAQEIQQHKPDIVVDLTSVDAVYTHAQIIIQHQVCPVIGTSGLTETQIHSLIEAAAQRNLGGIIVPNFSLSAVLMMYYSAQAARFFQKAEIIEMHHPFKKDSPSFTAKKTAESMKMAASVPIHSLLLPGIVANQEVIFGNPAETFSVKYNVIHREAFMPGLLLACQKVTQFKAIHYGLEHCLDLGPRS